VSFFNIIFFRRLDEETRNVIVKSYAGEVIDRVKGGSSSREMPLSAWRVASGYISHL
jgi:hypothetical protein